MFGTENLQPGTTQEASNEAMESLFDILSAQLLAGSVQALQKACFGCLRGAFTLSQKGNL
jgi:hypothetical protein